MKYALSTPSIINKNYKFNNKINKLLLHDLNESEPKSKVLAKIQKIIKTEKSLYNKNFDFNYNKEYHITRNHIKSFDKIQKTKKDIINYLKNENKKFKKIFQTNSKEFKTLSFNSLNKQKNLKKTLSLLINNNYENNIFIESPLLMSNNKDIYKYYSNYDKHNDNVYKDKNTNIPIIDEENDESIKFSQKLLGNLNGKYTYKKKNTVNSILNHSSYNNEYFLKNKKKYRNFMKEVIQENQEIKKYNSSIKNLLIDLKRNIRHSTKIIKNTKFLNFKKIGNMNPANNPKMRRRSSLGNIFSDKQFNSISIFDKLFKDMLKNKSIEKEQSISHIESIYDDIQKMKDKFLSYKIDKKLNLNNLNYINLRKTNTMLIEKEQDENKKVENLDFELLWRFHNYKNFNFK